jgi:hypothetical protein
MTVISIIVGSTREGRFLGKARALDFATPKDARRRRRAARRAGSTV